MVSSPSLPNRWAIPPCESNEKVISPHYLQEKKKKEKAEKPKADAVAHTACPSVLLPRPLSCGPAQADAAAKKTAKEARKAAFADKQFAPAPKKDQKKGAKEEKPSKAATGPAAVGTVSFPKTVSEAVRLKVLVAALASHQSPAMDDNGKGAVWPFGCCG